MFITSSCRSGLAPCCNNLSTTSTCPYLDATISELHPSCIERKVFGEVMMLTYLTYSVFWRISSLPGFCSTIQNYVYTRVGLPYSAGLVWLRAVITCPPPPHAPPETQLSENSIHPDMRRHQKLRLCSASTCDFLHQTNTQSIHKSVLNLKLTS